MNYSTRAGSSGAGGDGTINDSPIYHNRSFVLRKNNLLRSSRLVGNSTPNVLATVASTISNTSSSLSYSVANNNNMGR
jgi:hypothetical protein